MPLKLAYELHYKIKEQPETTLGRFSISHKHCEVKQKHDERFDLTISDFALPNRASNSKWPFWDITTQAQL